MLEILLGVLLFTGIVLVLALVIMAARAWLVPSGNVQISVNAERDLDVPVGDKLLAVLAANDLFLPSACGGGGTLWAVRRPHYRRRGTVAADRGVTHHEARGRWRRAPGVPGVGDARPQRPGARGGVRRQAVGVHGALERKLRDVHQGTRARVPRGETWTSAPAAISRSSARRTSWRIEISIFPSSSARTGSVSDSCNWSRR